MSMASSGDHGSAHYKYIVIGGGIAGVTCAEGLSCLAGEDDTLLITASPLIKSVTNFKMVTKRLEEFDVEEQPGHLLETKCSNVHVIHTSVTSLDTAAKVLKTADGQTFTYKYICLCSGGTPNVIAKDNPYVLGIRDTETVQVFQKRLKDARRILVVGNGGIATEVVYEIEGCQVVWAIKHKSIISTFVDAGAAKFLLPQLAADRKKVKDAGPSKRLKYTREDDVTTVEKKSANVAGSALGPDWSEGVPLHGSAMGVHPIHVEYTVEVDSVWTPQEYRESQIQQELPFSADAPSEDWPVYVKLTNGKVYGCDFVVSATGVMPNTSPFTDCNQFELAEDGGICVNDKMMTSIPSVYAAGDVCTASWTLAPHWHQMRLWSQARQMGYYAAKCMVAADQDEDISLDFCFELFAHITKFFGYKLILLGQFNGQGLGADHELLLRVTEGVEYVKVVLKDGQMQGAILIGETDLEETFENLILNETDLTVYGEDLLNPNIDIDDYFD